MQKLGASFMEFPLNPCPKGFPTIFLTHQPPLVTHGMSGRGLQLSAPQCSHLSFGSMMTNFNETMHATHGHSACHRVGTNYIKAGTLEAVIVCSFTP